MSRHRHSRRAARPSRTALASPAVLVLALLAPGARAEWRGGVEGGASVGGSSGTLLRLTLRNDERPLTHRLFADWVRRADDGNAWRLGYVPRYHFSPNAYAFGETGLRGDRALGIDSEVRALAGVGAGIELGAGASAYLELGAGAARTALDDPCDGVDPVAGGPCAGVDADDAEVDGLGVLRAGAAATPLERVRLGVDADIERRGGSTELRAETSAAVTVPGGRASVTLRTRRLSPENGDATSVTDTFVGYSLGF